MIARLGALRAAGHAAVSADPARYTGAARNVLTHPLRGFVAFCSPCFDFIVQRLFGAIELEAPATAACSGRAQNKSPR